MKRGPIRDLNGMSGGPGWRLDGIRVFIHVHVMASREVIFRPSGLKPTSSSI
ncbi:hypothetical protein HanIR_Chr02g0085831 [Helianthus annuus]|nr:hypothetical protein HanIR_Chr02g0085831 [Helianthus annuus]